MTQHLYVWQVSLQVTSPERPALRHGLQYRVQALSGARDVAIDKAKQIAMKQVQHNGIPEEALN